MGLRIIYGRAGTGKSEYIYNEIKDTINKKEKIFVITPEQFSFTAETKLLDALNTEAVIDAEILTFKRMAFRVRNEVGELLKTDLVSYGKSMIVYDILDKSKKTLKFLGKTTKNVEIITRLLTELKTHSININDIYKLIQEEKDEYLKIKLKDIVYIYEQFENRIKEQFLDENDVLTILEKQISSTDIFKNAIIYIDEFVGFTPQEYKIIKKLLEITKQVSITICTDSLIQGMNEDSDIFHTNKKTASKLINLANLNGIKIENPIYLNKSYRFKNRELKHIEENIYNIAYKKMLNDIKNIELFLSENQYSEIEYVAEKIIKLVRDEGYRYKDISIICRDIDIYDSLAKAIFKQYEIPIFIDKKKDLSQDILIKYILSLLEVFSKNWDYDSVINYIKSGFCNLTDEEIFLIEKFARKWGIKYNKWYSKDWKIADENIDKLNEIRRKIVNPLLDFKSAIDGNKTAIQITRTIHKFLIENNIQEKLKKIINNNQIPEEIKKEIIPSWNLLMKILDEIVLIFSDEKMSIDKYSQIIKIAVNENNLGLIPLSIDQVTLGDINRSKSKKSKIIFIIGLNDGVFPSANREEGFINDSDRDKLKQKGIELAKTTKEQIYEENFNIYKAFTTAEEKLFLSYSSAKPDGSAIKPSTIIYKIKRIFPNIKEKSNIITKEDFIKNPKATLEGLLINLRKLQDGEKIKPVWFEVYKIFMKEKDWNETLKNAIQGQTYTNIPQNITKENIEKMYGDVLFTSVSRLEQYRRCPFSFYLKYGLNINENDEFQIKSIDTGTFMHEIIDSFFGKIQDENINIRNIEDEELQQIINEIIEIKLQLNKNYIFTSTAKFRTLTRKLKNVIIQSLKYIVDSIKNSDFEVLGHEIEFGKVGKYPAIEIKLEDGKRVEIIGKIDRVDILKTSDGKYVRIIDYKSSIKSIDLEEVMAGIQIQLITYMDAITKIEDFMPAGILYFNLIEPTLTNINRNNSNEEIESLIRKKFRMNGIVLSDINIVRSMDKNLKNGSSNIIPVYIDTKNNISQSKSSCMNKEEFKDLEKKTIEIIKQISKEIYDGKIEINPYSRNTKTTCDYCNFKSICQHRTF